MDTHHVIRILLRLDEMRETLLECTALQPTNPDLQMLAAVLSDTTFSFQSRLPEAHKE